MFIQIFLLFFLLFLLFLLSRKIASYIFKIVYLLTGWRKFAIAILSVIILPGTLIHEFSHLVFAALLRVHTGTLTVFPTIGKNGEVTTGKLEIVKPDPFRHILIGLAPMITGLSIIYATGKFLLPSFSQLTTQNLLALPIEKQLAIILSLYLFFTTSITMFSSRKDLESLIIAGPILFLIGLSLYLVGVRIVFEESLIKKITDILSEQNYYLLIATILDYLIFVVLGLFVNAIQKIFKKKISFQLATRQ